MGAVPAPHRACERPSDGPGFSGTAGRAPPWSTMRTPAHLLHHTVLHTSPISSGTARITSK